MSASLEEAVAYMAAHISEGPLEWYKECLVALSAQHKLPTEKIHEIILTVRNS